MTMNNHWQVYDTSEPLLQWQFAAPLPSSSSSSSSSEAIVAAVRAALLPLVTVVGAPLPDVDAALAARPGLFRSTVTVNDAGQLVDVEAADAGELLRRLEGPSLDPGYARRFAALGHPFVAVWANNTTPARLSVTVAFFATVWFDARDTALHARNQVRLLAARDALTTVARRHGGQLQAPAALGV